MPVASVPPDELAPPGAPYAAAEPAYNEGWDDEAPDFQFPGWEEEPRHHRRHRRNKVIKFILLELLALALLIVATKLEVAGQFTENPLTILYKILMGLAVIALAAIPVVFFALPPRLPPGRY